MSQAWPLVALGEVLSSVSRAESVHPTKEYRLLGVRLEGAGPFLRETKLGSQSAATTLYRVEADDFIYSRLFAWRGAFGIISPELSGCYVSGEFPIFKPVPEQLDVRFLRLWFRLPTVIRQVEADCSGSTPLTRNRFKERFFTALKIPLPPLAEQQRIVARVEQLAAKIDEARGLREQASKEIETLSARTASTLFNSYEWPQAALGTLLREESLNGLGVCPSDTPPGTPILRISAGTSRADGIVNEADYKYLQVDEKTLSRYKLESGDLLACRFNGNLRFVGRISIYTGYSNESHIYPDKLIRFRVNPEMVSSRFVLLAMNSPMGRVGIEAFCATTAGNIGISAGNLKAVKIPVPPLPEQRRIVSYLNGLQAKVDALKQLQAQTQAEFDALLPAVLDRAFKGQL